MFFIFFVFDESFSSFLVFQKGWGFWPFPLLGWEFSERAWPLPFPVWSWPFLLGWPFPLSGLGWVGVGPSGRGWRGLDPKGRRPDQKGKARGPATREGRGRTTQESRKGEAGPDPKGEDGKAHLLLIYI